MPTFRPNRKLLNGSLLIMAILWLLYLGAIMLGPHVIISRVITLTIIGIVILILAWIGFAYGTGITIDENRKLLYARLFFLKLSSISLLDVVSLNERKTFAGGITRLYFVYKTARGSISDFDVVGKESLTKEDIQRLLQTIRSANPKIEFRLSE